MTAAQHILSVELGDRSYPIYIGSGLLQQAQLLRQHITGKQVLIVTNDTIASLYLPTILKTLDNLHIDGLQTDTVVLSDGEQHKHLETVSLIWDHLLQQRHRRLTARKRHAQKGQPT